MHRLAGVLVVVGLWGCTYSTQAVIDIGLASGADRPANIEVWVYDARGKRATKSFSGAGLPGRVVLQLISNPVEAARINADGRLGPFVEVGRLTHNRWRPNAIVIGNRIYVSGGFRNSNSTVVATLEHAVIRPDGTLDPFVPTGVSMMQARRAHASAIVGNYLYVIGGSSDQGEASLDSVERSPIAADGTLGPFQAAGQLAHKRTGPVAAVIGRYLYVLGGYDGSAAAYPEALERAAIADDGTIGPFAETGGPWTQSRANSGAVVLGSSLYIAGGYLFGSPLNDVFRATLDISGNLTTPAQMPVSMTRTRYDFALALVENRVYAVGSGSGDDLVEHSSIIGGNTLAKFATVTTSQIPTPSSDASSVVLGRWLYLIGGAEHPKQVLRAPIGADGTPGTWADAGITLKVNRSGASLAVLDDKLWVFGGSNPSPSVESATIAADGTLGPFAVVSLVNTTKSRGGAVAVAKGGYIYMLGGDTQGPAPLDIERAQITNGNTLGTFTGLAMPLLAAPGRPASSGVLISDSLYVHGGYDANTTNFFDTSVFLSLPSVGPMGMFTADKMMVRTRGHHSAVMVGSNLFLIGGQYIDTVERATVNADGTLSAFLAPPQSRLLATERWHHESALLGNYVYVIGGVPDTVNVSDKVDRAEINP